MIAKLLQIKYYIFLSIFFGFISSYLIFLNTERNIDSFLQHQVELAQLEYDTIYKELKTQSSLIFQEHINNDQVLTLFAQADTEDKELQDKIRTQLYTHLSQTYIRLKRLLNLRQLHFHLKNNNSFLRMHYPEKYGDDLSKIRETVAYVNRTKKPIDSFEEGRLYNGFRFVYPLFDKKKKHLGSVEVSFSADSFQRTITSNIHFSQFIISKKVVDKKVWKDDNLVNYVQTDISPLFLFEKSQNDYKFLELRAKISSNITEQTKQLFHQNTYTNKAFAIPIVMDNKTAVINFIPVQNKLSHQPVAYFAIVSQSNYINQLYDEMHLTQAIAFTLILSIFVLFFIQSKHTQMLKKKEKINKQLQERINLAISANNDGVWEWDIQTNETYYSDRWKEMLGYQGDDIENTGASFMDNVHPEDIDYVMNSIQKCQDNPESYLDITFRMKHKKGHWIWISDRGQTFYDNNRAIKMIGTHTDITKEKKLQLKYAQQANIIEQMYDSVSTTDLEGHILTWNRASEKLLGYSKMEIIGKNIALLKHAEDLEEMKKNISKIHEEGQFQGEVRLRTKEGESVSVAVRTSLMYNEKNEPIGILHYAKDMTEYNKIKDNLEAKHMLLIQQGRLASMGEMIANIAHQWRQPLNALGLITQKIQFYNQNGTLSDQIINENVDKSMQLIDKMSHTIDDFRNFFDPNKHKESFLIEESILNAYNILESIFAQYNIDFTIESSHSDITLHSFSNELSQVIVNILNNAKDSFLANNIKEPRIRITIKKEEENIFINICDNAGGIDAEILPKVFDPYFSTKEQGSGIGLYMSKIIISEHMNGEINVSSAQGHTCFKIEFRKN